ncbi:hypothetical protein CDD81_1713 [Ophiocordyceps australis]|uniref:DUF1996 domain-containing protein n=1 Tax=Ophiocordyceps australis TaxID=1399860 RepID=A0A2C5YA92_9HYPO|nr:hypothetical protein CDD81_1713 [Ophiocordyceps australis]
MLQHALVASAALVAGANAFWRMECPGRVGLARMDPIMNPGEMSPHVHSIHGSSGFTESASTQDLLDGGCTSCRVTQDKSSYWHPALYFQHADTASYELVPQVGGMLSYYLLYGDNITAFPPGFRMLSGTTERRTYTVGDPAKPDPPKSMWASLGQTKQEDLAQRALGFNCLNYDKTPEGTLYRHYLPDKAYLDANCKDGIRLETMFPSCWRGGDAIDSANHKDHVAFPDLVMTGTCPEGYPVRTPSLLYEVIWNTAAFKNKNGRFVFSNGDTTGYGYHSDFMMGWNPAVLQEAVDNCRNPSGRIEDCSVFDVVDEGTATSCSLSRPLPQALARENVKGPMAKLPGNSDAPTFDDSKSPQVSLDPSPSLTYQPGEKASESASPLPGQIFKEKSKSKPSFAAADIPAPSAAPPAAPTPVVNAAAPVENSAAPAVNSAAPVENSAAPAVNSAAPVVSSAAPVAESQTTQAPTTAVPAPGPAVENKEYYSTEWATSGSIVSKILWEAQTETVYVTEPAASIPTGVAKAVLRRHRMGNLHGHGHGRFMH